MKKYFAVVAIFCLLMLAIPSVSLLGKGSTHEKKPDETSIVFNVLDEETGEIITYSQRDYVIGAVLAEIPVSYHNESIKAQAVAANTYAIKLKLNEYLSPTKELKGADFSNNPEKYQAFFTAEDAKEFYGENYDSNQKKVAALVDEVVNKVLVYDSIPINAAFHAISGGITESASVVWGSEISYLTPTVSAGDLTSPDFLAQVSFTSEEMQTLLIDNFPDLVLPDGPANWFKISDRSYSGSVTQIAVGDKTLTGSQLRSKLGLRSANFEVTFAENTFVFTTKGYGHGVGLSQYGANTLAQDKMSYDQILLHYYSGAALVDISNLSLPITKQ